jgi:hypothetical protein
VSANQRLLSKKSPFVWNLLFEVGSFEVGQQVVLKCRRKGCHVELVVKAVGADRKDALGADGLRIVLDGCAVEGVRFVRRIDEPVHFDATSDLNAVQDNVIFFKDDEARIPEDGMTVLFGIVLVPGFLPEEDGVFVFVRDAFELFRISGVVDGWEFREALTGPFAGKAELHSCQDIFHVACFNEFTGHARELQSCGDGAREARTFVTKWPNAGIPN